MRFAVMVKTTNSGLMVDELLAPYSQTDENYLTEFIDETEEVEASWNSLTEEDKDKYKTIDNFSEVYFGFSKQDNLFGYYTNPDGIWDWWVEGGRWNDFFLFKNGTRGNSSVKNNIDIEGMLQAEYNESVQRLDQLDAFKLKYPNFESLSSVFNRLGTTGEAYNFFHSQEGHEEFYKTFGFSFTCIHEKLKNGNREEYLSENKVFSRTFNAFAILDEENGYLESSSINFKEWFDAINENDTLTLVDLHS